MMKRTKRTRPRSCGFEVNPDVLEKQDLVHQGESAERIAQKWKISREDLDAFATESHGRASAAAREGKNKEILPTPGLDPDGNEVELTTDEGIRHNIDARKMANLKTVFRPEGEGGVTAGNSSQLTDGASALLVGDREVAESDEAGTTSLSQKPTWTRRMWRRYCTRQGRPPLPKALC
jgi:acetyl-CoA acyltransferase